MGKFWPIGVGPGDPGLLTLKAVEILRRVQVIYHAGPKPDRGRAWSIVHSYLRPDQEVRILLMESMASASASDGKKPYQSAVDRIAVDCRAGNDLALITEGDPTLYSTAANVWQLLQERHPDIPIEVVPGVSSITAAAARVGWPLAQKDEALAALPAGYHAEQLAKVLHDFPTVCLLKVSQVLPQVLSFLENDGEERQAVYLENLGTPEEWMTTDLREAIGRNEYFSQVLVRRRRVACGQWPVASKEVGSGSGMPLVRLEDSAHPTVSAKLWVVGLGPGDPEPCTYAVDSIRRLMGRQPIFGICLGHQLTGIALGGKTFKLKFGHHGGNHPVKQLDTGKIEITAHNHNFAVDPNSLKQSDVDLTHIDLNDDTLEGLRHRELPLFSVQYHPEASPGPHDSQYLFRDFVTMMEEWRG